MSDAAIIAFRKRRTYLDECRERGIFQKTEELKAENAALSAQLSNACDEARADVIPLADHSRQVAAFADLTAAAQLEARFRAFIDAYEAVIGGPFVPLLKHVLFETSHSAVAAEDLFRAAITSDNNIKAYSHE